MEKKTLKNNNYNYAKSEQLPKKELTRQERILLYKENNKIPNRKDRKRKKYSDNFNQMFNFFLKSYRCKILDFCGVDVKTRFDINEEEGKFCFRKFDNGEYPKEFIYNDGIPSRHNNILRGVIIGKKGWGLFLQETTSGIAEGCFTEKEILQQFEDNDIIIPDCLLQDFRNIKYKKMKEMYNSIYNKVS